MGDPQKVEVCLGDKPKQPEMTAYSSLIVVHNVETINTDLIIFNHSKNIYEP